MSGRLSSLAARPRVRWRHRAPCRTAEDASAAAARRCRAHAAAARGASSGGRGRGKGRARRTSAQKGPPRRARGASAPLGRRGPRGRQQRARPERHVARRGAAGAPPPLGSGGRMASSQEQQHAGSYTHGHKSGGKYYHALASKDEPLLQQGRHEAAPRSPSRSSSRRHEDGARHNSSNSSSNEGGASWPPPPPRHHSEHSLLQQAPPPATMTASASPSTEAAESAAAAAAAAAAAGSSWVEGVEEAVAVVITGWRPRIRKVQAGVPPRRHRRPHRAGKLVRVIAEDGAGGALQVPGRQRAVWPLASRGSRRALLLLLRRTGAARCVALRCAAPRCRSAWKTRRCFGKGASSRSGRSPAPPRAAPARDSRRAGRQCSAASRSSAGWLPRWPSRARTGTIVRRRTAHVRPERGVAAAAAAAATVPARRGMLRFDHVVGVQWTDDAASADELGGGGGDGGALEVLAWRTTRSNPNTYALWSLRLQSARREVLARWYGRNSLEQRRDLARVDAA
eukprot:scaffold2176_cov350-Prasinococcus_capsulatus_cf.AAC.1